MALLEECYQVAVDLAKKAGAVSLCKTVAKP